LNLAVLQSWPSLNSGEGIAGVEEFRDAVLDQRDRVSDRDDDDTLKRPAVSPPQDETTVLLTDIHDCLKRIVKGLSESGSPRGGRGR
jgi:putative membrane protein